MTHTNICLKKFVDTIYLFFFKADDVTIIISGIISVIPKGKSASDSNLVFVKFLLNPTSSRSFVVSICLLVSFQSSVNFFNASLFLFAEARTKYLIPSFLTKYPSTLLKARKKNSDQYQYYQYSHD